MIQPEPDVLPFETAFLSELKDVGGGEFIPSIPGRRLVKVFRRVYITLPSIVHGILRVFAIMKGER
jgi:hypothetical protein